jgi:hypothetical protein
MVFLREGEKNIELQLISKRAAAHERQLDRTTSDQE